MAAQSTQYSASIYANGAERAYFNSLLSLFLHFGADLASNAVTRTNKVCTAFRRNVENVYVTIVFFSRNVFFFCIFACVVVQMQSHMRYSRNINVIYN